jgi:hypothetical protein
MGWPRLVISALTALVLCLATECSLAGPWFFTELFSNADGSVQFIELTCGNFNNEQNISTAEIRETTSGNVFVIPTALPSTATANRSILIATDNFESLPGAILPDYPTYPGLPPHFFDSNGDGLIFYHSTHGIMDQRGFFSIPTDGVHSLDLKAGGVRVNSPTNFSGQVGSVNLAQLTGDYNGNGAVDAADYIVWRRNLGSSNSLPNDSTPGSVAAEDYGVWRQNFGRSAAGGTADAAVPEPGSVVALSALAGLFFGWTCIRRPQSL